VADFLPDGFEPPPGHEHERFRLRPITIHDVVKDYDAVMSSREHLWEQFGDVWGWPPADLTLEQDLIDLAWHQKEAQLKESFNFAVMSPDESRLLGCVYVDPPEKAGYGAEVTWWVRADELDSGLDDAVGAAARVWLGREWPFERVAYPGRDLSWEEYDALPGS
jgi:hypothetical protein